MTQDQGATIVSQAALSLLSSLTTTEQLVAAESIFVEVLNRCALPTQQPAAPVRLWQKIYAWCKKNPTPDGVFRIADIQKALFSDTKNQQALVFSTIGRRSHGRGAVFVPAGAGRFRLRATPVSAAAVAAAIAASQKTATGRLLRADR